MGGLISYVQPEDIQDELGDTTGYPSASLERAGLAATGWINRRCQRHFWLDDAPSTRLIRPTSRVVLRPGDFPYPEQTTVEVDRSGTGSWQAFTQWQAEPFVPDFGWPYERITPTGLLTWPLDSYTATVKVTSVWGWLSVPSEVEQACSILTIFYLSGKEIVSMHDGFDVDAQGPSNPVAIALHLLRDYLPHPSVDPSLPASYSPLS